MTTAPSLYIAVPCFRSQVYVNCIHSLLALTSALVVAGVKSEVRFASGALVGMARNEIAADFLDSGATHLLMVDDDVGGFRADEIAALMTVDVGAIPCPYRGEGAGFAVMLHEGCIGEGEISTLVTQNGKQLIEVRGAGTGIMSIRREVFLRMIEAFGDHITYVNAHSFGGAGSTARQWDFFSTGPDRSEPNPLMRGYYGEDISFCRRWQRLGGKVHALVGAHPTHFGAHEFTSEGTPSSVDFATWLRAALVTKASAARVT